MFDFESIGGSDEITLIHGEGGLQRLFQETGMMAGWGWKKQKNLVRPVHMEDLDDNIPADIRAALEGAGAGADAVADRQTDAEELADSDADF